MHKMLTNMQKCGIMRCIVWFLIKESSMKLDLMRGYSESEPKVHIGTLEYTGTEYVWFYSDAKSKYDFWDGFFEVPGLPMGEVSRSTELFWFFKDRIPSCRRADFKDYLEMFGFEEYNEWDFVVASGLRSGIDSDELVER